MDAGLSRILHLAQPLRQSLTIDSFSFLLIGLKLRDSNKKVLLIAWLHEIPQELPVGFGMSNN